jgi:beta-glucosidase
VGDASYDPQFPYGWGLTTLAEAPQGGAGTLRALGAAAAAAERAGDGRAGRALVTKARLIVQRKAGQRVTASMAGPFADADHLLLTGKYGKAVRKLEEAYKAAANPAA